MSKKELKKNKKLPDNQITIYQSPDGLVNIEVFYADENIWLTQKLIAELFNIDIRTVNEHLKNIFFAGTEPLLDLKQLIIITLFILWILCSILLFAR